MNAMEENSTGTYNLSEELAILASERVRLLYNKFEDLTLQLDGSEQQRVFAKRLFPISEIDKFIAISDEEGTEIGLITDMSALDSVSRETLEAELERHYFYAQITRVVSMTGGHMGISEWEVETSRGPRIFEIRSNRRDIRHIGGGRVLIRDADGNRFEIPDYRALDPFSCDLVESQV